MYAASKRLVVAAVTGSLLLAGDGGRAAGVRDRRQPRGVGAACGALDVRW